jgi:hypothetical protein
MQPSILVAVQYEHTGEQVHSFHSVDLPNYFCLLAQIKVLHWMSQARPLECPKERSVYAFSQKCGPSTALLKRGLRLGSQRE